MQSMNAGGCHSINYSSSSFHVLQSYKLADAEANLLLPCLVEKAGHSQVKLQCAWLQR